jgi:glycosyltransferase involved in cell wall biosynthesis
MRVLYFSDNGSDHNRRFVEKITSFGHELFFLDITGQQPRFPMPPRAVRITAHQTFPREAPPNVVRAFLPELQSLISDLRLDLVHAGPMQSCGYLAALAGFHPLIVMSWGSDLLLHAERDATWRAAIELALRGADGFACDCEAVRSAGLRYASFPPTHIAMFPWGLEPGIFSALGDKVPDWTPTHGTTTILCTRSWEPLYDIEVLLEAFAMAYEMNKKLRLLLLGDGSQRDLIHKFIAERDLAGIVCTRQETHSSFMPRWFRAADVYVSCARSDGTSISLLEAMATGLPVVVSDIPSNREWVTPDENGWLASVGSAQDFAEKLLRAASLDPEQAKTLRANNNQVIALRANWDQNFPALMNLYEVVATTPRQTCVTG